MNITPRVITYAIHRILVSEQVTVGCSLPVKTLMSAWSHSALRQTDLGRGLDALRQDGAVALKHSPEGLMLHLLSEEFGLVMDRKDREALDLLNRLRELRGGKRVSMSPASNAAPKAVVQRRRSDLVPQLH